MSRARYAGRVVASAALLGACLVAGCGAAAARPVPPAGQSAESVSTTTVRDASPWQQPGAGGLPWPTQLLLGHPLLLPVPPAALPPATESTDASSAAEPSDGAAAEPATSEPPALAPSTARGTPWSRQAPGTYRGIRIEPGTYIMWKKSANTVLLVRDGRLVRAMPTSDLDWKTPVGTYHVTDKIRQDAAYDQGHWWTLNHFVVYGPIPGHTAIGFHEDPVRNGNVYIQPLHTIGSDAYHSHGCERLTPADAKAVWAFAKVGTEVRVR